MQRQLPDVTAEAKSAPPILDVAIGESEALPFKNRLFLNLLTSDLQKNVADNGDIYLAHYFGKLTLFPSAIENRDMAVIQLLKHVIRGELKEADVMLQREPRLALEENTVTDYSGRTIQGTALKMALGALDVCAHGTCDLVIVKSKNGWRDRMVSPESQSLYIYHRKELHYIDRTNHQTTQIPLTEAQQKEFEALLTHEIRLSIWDETAVRLSKDILKKIATITGHIHEESMAEMIMRHLRKLPNGEAEIAKQVNEQFPAGWEIEEEKRVKRDKEALLALFNAVKAEKMNASDIHIAIWRFRDYLEKENDPKIIIKAGKQFNEQILFDALDIYTKYYNKHRISKNSMFWQAVIGGIQRYFPANMAQELLQGAHFITKAGSKLRRSLQFRNKLSSISSDNYFYPLNFSHRLYQLGENYAVHWDGGLSSCGGPGQQQWSPLQSLCKANTTSLANLCNAYKPATPFVRDRNRLK